MFKMNCRRRSALLSILAALPMLGIASLYCHFAGGQGSIDDPYRIAEARHLDNIRRYTGDQNERLFFIQTADIDLDIEPYNSNAGWIPIRDFRGSYDGNGFEIRNLYINGPYSGQTARMGLFGTIYNGCLSNITLVDVNIIAFDNSGALAGISERSSIAYSSSSGKITGSSNRGLNIGGLAGNNSRSIITDSHSTVTVNAYNRVGGITGHNFANAHVTRSFFYGEVQGNNEVGGITGRNYTGDLTDCYNRGSVSGRRNVGGLVGISLNRSFVTNCYSTGSVEASVNAGGLIGSVNETETENSYWDVQSSQINESAAGEPRFSDQMKYPQAANTYVRWDFDETWIADRYSHTNDGYPFLSSYTKYLTDRPVPAVRPYPADEQADVTVLIDSLKWSYKPHDNYPNPVVFKLYIVKEKPFSTHYLVEYIDGQADFSISLEDKVPIEYDQSYYWQVIPTIDAADSSRDAKDCPVWSFTTMELIPYPKGAECIEPADGAENVSLELEKLSWAYKPDIEHKDPLGFRVYLNTSGDFSEDDTFHWENYYEDRKVYSMQLSQRLRQDTAYYWKVVPTTRFPDSYNEGSGEEKLLCSEPPSVPVWSFRTEKTTLVDAEPGSRTPPFLVGNYPNPFNPETVIAFKLREKSSVRLEVFNIRGELIRVLADRVFNAGEIKVAWDGRDKQGQPAGSGVFIYRMETSGYSASGKMLLLR